jgi:hypothetical protein
VQILFQLLIHQKRIWMNISTEAEPIENYSALLIAGKK